VPVSPSRSRSASSSVTRASIRSLCSAPFTVSTTSYSRGIGAGGGAAGAGCSRGWRLQPRSTNANPVHRHVSARRAPGTTPGGTPARVGVVRRSTSVSLGGCLRSVDGDAGEAAVSHGSERAPTPADVGQLLGPHCLRRDIRRARREPRRAARDVGWPARRDRLVESGQAKPVIERRHALAEAAPALRHVGEGHARGQTVIGSTDPARRAGAVPSSCGGQATRGRFSRPRLQQCMSRSSRACRRPPRSRPSVPAASRYRRAHVEARRV